jgi:hypothetical protein
MVGEEIARRKEELVAATGPWTAHNIWLGGDQWTLDAQPTARAELSGRRVIQVLQALRDLTRQPLDHLRILDLGALEGLYAVELARQGAEVVAIEGRATNSRKIDFAREVLGLDQLTVLTEDIRELDPARHGQFDVVLALGVLYHLPAHQLLDFLRRIVATTRMFALLETQVALRPKEQLLLDGHSFSGLTYEEPDSPWAAVGNRESFWLTKPSLLRAVSLAGFSSAAELLTPLVEPVMQYQDHLLLCAFTGQRWETMPTPDADHSMDASWYWPERLRRIAHPAQGGRHLLRDRLGQWATRIATRVGRVCRASATTSP